MRVVIADDDALVSVSLKTILEASGDIQVQAMGITAAQAVQLYEENQPDVLLLDIQMGEESGLDAAQKVLKRNPDAKVLF